MVYQNHVVDPTYFYDAVEEFAFNFDWYPVKDMDTNAKGKLVYTYGHEIIRGSLQSQGTTLNQSEALNSENMEYEFYCMSLYRIHEGDFIFYKERWLRCFQVYDYDEWGVRRATLRMVDLTNYRDFAEYLNYLNGTVLV